MIDAWPTLLQASTKFSVGSMVMLANGVVGDAYLKKFHSEYVQAIIANKAGGGALMAN